MRKLTALLVSCAIVFSALSVNAESIDLSTYSDSDLQALYEKIGNELAERNVLKSADLHGGHYVAGSDIPAGRYTMEFISNGDNKFINYYVFNTADDFANVDWWDSEDPHAPIIKESVWKDSGKTIKLDEGQVLYVESGDFKLTVDVITWN